MVWFGASLGVKLSFYINYIKLELCEYEANVLVPLKELFKIYD